MQAQLFVNNKPSPSKMDPIINQFWIKPLGGLWTSSWRPETQDSEWIEWCRSELPDRTNPSRWLLYPRKNVKLLTIDSKKDCQQLFATYPKKEQISSKLLRSLDFEAMEKDYDGMHLTSRGQIATRFTHPGLYGWDCESTLWFRWVFTRIQKIKKQKSKARELEKKND